MITDQCLQNDDLADVLHHDFRSSLSNEVAALKKTQRIHWVSFPEGSAWAENFKVHSKKKQTKKKKVQCLRCQSFKGTNLSSVANLTEIAVDRSVFYRLQLNTSFTLKLDRTDCQSTFCLKIETQ